MKARTQGEITSWNDDRGFGFITPVSGGERIFVHITAIQNRKRPQLNQTVFYAPSRGKDGRPRAAGVTYKKKSMRWLGVVTSGLVVGLFFTILGILVVILQTVPAFILWLYLGASTITFIVYAIDKRAAQKKRWRISEAKLHGLSLIGGWPGALIAQKTLHHKSRKVSFQAMYKFTVVLNIAITTWLLTPRGPELTMMFLKKLSK